MDTTADRDKRKCIHFARHQGCKHVEDSGACYAHIRFWTHGWLTFACNLAETFLKIVKHGLCCGLRGW